jgi:hypothetical protein
MQREVWRKFKVMENKKMGETFANHISDKGLVSRIYKIVQLNIKKITQGE